MPVMSVRLSDEEDRRLREAAQEEKTEKSRLARELMMDGLKYKLLVRYAKGKISLGMLARGLGLVTSEAIDFLAELGIPSPVTYDDYLASLESSEKLLGASIVLDRPKKGKRRPSRP